VHDAQIVTAAHRTLAVVVLGVATLLLPALVPTYYLILLSSALALAIACLALNLLLGTTGLVSFGHAAYFGLGAYAGGFLYTVLDVGPDRPLGLHLRHRAIQGRCGPSGPLTPCTPIGPTGP
jgi:ABC-type branched-subunit amino acid transport system permease subunit